MCLYAYSWFHLVYNCRLIIFNGKIIWYLYTSSRFFISTEAAAYNLQLSPSCINIYVPQPLRYVLWWYPNSGFHLCINYSSFSSQIVLRWSLMHAKYLCMFVFLCNDWWDKYIYLFDFWIISLFMHSINWFFLTCLF